MMYDLLDISLDCSDQELSFETSEIGLILFSSTSEPGKVRLTGLMLAGSRLAITLSREQNGQEFV